MAKPQNILLKKLGKILGNEQIDRHQALREALAEEPPQDIAEILDTFDEDEVLYIIEAVDDEQVAHILEETDDTSKRLVIERLRQTHPQRIAKIIELMSPDDGADLLGLLAPEDEDAILSEIEPEKRSVLHDLLSYEPDTAGGIMTSQFIWVSNEATVKDALNRLRGDPTAEIENFVFVVDRNRRYQGTVPIKKIITAGLDTPITDLIDKNQVSVETTVDQEEVANIIDKYNLEVVPVTNPNNILKGIVTVDDVIDVMREEYSEDMYRIAGTSALQPTKEAIHQRVFKRLPFLFVTLLGGIIGIIILNAYKASIEEYAIVFVFLPIVNALAGNVGLQSATIMVRGIATGEVSTSRIVRIYFSELAIGAIIGILCGLVVAGVSLFIAFDKPIGLIIMVAILCGTSTAATMGTIIPLVCYKIGIDPAIAAGPFITMVNDVTGMLIYLGISSIFLFT